MATSSQPTAKTNKEDLIEFLIEFFKKLNNKLKGGNMCFVSGTYIFEGDDMFKRLQNISTEKRVGQTVTNPKSHNLHISNILFERHRLKLDENKYYNIELGTRSPSSESQSINNGNNIDIENYDKMLGIQYEIDLKTNTIDFPCDTDECNSNTIRPCKLSESGTSGTTVSGGTNTITVENLDNHIKNCLKECKVDNTYECDSKMQAQIIKSLKCKMNREAKKCVLYYLFKVNYDKKEEMVGGNWFLNFFKNTDRTQLQQKKVVYEPNGPELTQYYTFVKLEKSPTINLKDLAHHTKDAFYHYFGSNGIKRNNLYNQRREDMLEIKATDTTDTIFVKPSKIESVVENIAKISAKKDPYEFDDISTTADKIPYIHMGTDNAFYRETDTELNNPLTACADAATLYNHIARTRNEVFVPLKLYNHIMATNGGNTGTGQGGNLSNYIKTTEKYRYNNYDYRVYNKNNKLYIRIKYEYILLSKIKRKKGVKAIKSKKGKNAKSI